MPTENTDSSTIFLTGFPGFIATRLVRRLAGNGSELYLLVQPSLKELAAKESARISAEFGLAPDRIRLFEGDITRPDLGLDEGGAKQIRQHANRAFHLAAIYDLGVEKDLAIKVNVEGTKNVNRFVGSFRDLQHYHYVSTCYVAGKRTGRILETELEHSEGFRNNYEKTKYLAEIEVEKLKAELPVTIHRPSVVCGDSKTGETVKYDGIYYLILYLLKQPNLLSLFNIGNDAVRLNLVPVDFVVDAMASLSNEQTAIGKTLQLADPDPLTTRELFESISRHLVGRGSVITMPPPLVKTFLPLPLAPKITGLPASGVPYFFIDQTYDTAVSTRLLSKHGISCPRFPEYVENLVDFVKENPKL